jgi:hypothetical protein
MIAAGAREKGKYNLWKEFMIVRRTIVASIAGVVHEARLCYISGRLKFFSKGAVYLTTADCYIPSVSSILQPYHRSTNYPLRAPTGVSNGSTSAVDPSVGSRIVNKCLFRPIEGVLSSN